MPVVPGPPFFPFFPPAVGAPVPSHRLLNDRRGPGVPNLWPRILGPGFDRLCWRVPRRPRARSVGAGGRTVSGFCPPPRTRGRLVWFVPGLGRTGPDFRPYPAPRTEHPTERFSDLVLPRPNCPTLSASSPAALLCGRGRRTHWGARSACCAQFSRLDRTAWFGKPELTLGFGPLRLGTGYRASYRDRFCRPGPTEGARTRQNVNFLAHRACTGGRFEPGPLVRRPRGSRGVWAPTLVARPGCVVPFGKAGAPGVSRGVPANGPWALVFPRLRPPLNQVLSCPAGSSADRVALRIDLGWPLSPNRPCVL